MILLNFSHPLTADVLVKQIGWCVERLNSLPVADQEAP